MRGRRPASVVRDNLVEMLFVLKKAYGYELAVLYNQIFPSVTQRLIYYHLNRGTKMKVFNVAEIKKEAGNYSWGQSVEKVYYELGDGAMPKASERVIEALKGRVA